MRNILCVDDHLDTREMLEMALSHEGFAVTCVAGIEEAWIAAQNLRFDCFMIDQILAGECGTTLCERVRTLHNDTPIIIFSGAVDDDTLERAKAAGVNAIVKKPSNIQAILHTLRDLLPAKRQH